MASDCGGLANFEAGVRGSARRNGERRNRRARHGDRRSTDGSTRARRSRGNVPRTLYKAIGEVSVSVDGERTFRHARTGNCQRAPDLAGAIDGLAISRGPTAGLLKLGQCRPGLGADPGRTGRSWPQRTVSGDRHGRACPRHAQLCEHVRAGPDIVGPVDGDSTYFEHTWRRRVHLRDRAYSTSRAICLPRNDGMGGWCAGRAARGA